MGDHQNNTLVGLGGADVINGGANFDLLYGGAGADTLTGGSGDDYIVGGAGADVFAFNSLDDILHVNVNSTVDDIFGFDEAPLDTIEDFDSAEDSLALLASVFGGGGGGLVTLVGGTNFSIIADSFDGTNAGFNTNFGSGTATFVYSQQDDALYYDDNGSATGYYAVAYVDDLGIPGGGAS